MIRTLEIAWLCITVLSVCMAAFQLFTDCWQSALWMMFVSGIAMVMYSIRRKQRIKFESKDEKQLYH